MRLETSSISQGFSPKALIRLLTYIGLAAFAYALVRQQITFALVIATLPISIATIGYGFIHPRFIYLLYATYAFFFTTISRYIHMNQLSAGLEAILAYGVIAIIIISYYKKGSIKWNNAINVLTLSYIPWMLFSLFQLSNPGTNSDGVFTGIRIWIFRTFFLYLFLSLLSNTSKTLRIGINLIAFFTLLAFIKLLWQKYVGFDSAELYWLFVEGGARTHIIGSGIRYFSYFTDAANFGGFMATAGLVFSIIGFHESKNTFKIIYLTIAVTAFIGMFISGTRGALVVPMVGLMLYCLLCKNFRILIITALTGIFIFAFFSFTTIGNSNEYIRRARTAFHSSDDASMNVRLRNREEIAQFMAHHPLGAGIKSSIPKLWANSDGTYTLGTLPPDSFFVNIWIQTGIGGLILYLIICAIIILEGSRIVLFKIKDKQLRHTMAAFTCGVFGIWVSGYTGNNPDLPPTDFIIPAMMAFVMNGSTIDRELEQNNLLTTKAITRYDRLI